MFLRAYRKWPLPSLPFLLGIWPRGKYYLSQLYRWPNHAFNSSGGVAFGRPRHGRNLYRFYRWAGLRFAKPTALSRLAGEAFSQRHQNSYHNSHHVMQVMISAALLSVQASCRAADRQMLVLAAMAHDLGHQGMRTRRGPAVNEAAAAHRACRLFFRSGAQGVAHRQFTALIIATSPSAKLMNDGKTAQAPHACHDLAMLLCDADLFASLSYGRKMQYWLAAKVKFELRSTLPVTAILSNFLAKTRLQSRVANDLTVRSKPAHYLSGGQAKPVGNR